MRNRIKEEIKVSLDTPLIFSLKAIVPGEKKLVLFWACCVGSVPYRSGNNPRLGHPPSSISRLSSSSLTSNPPPPSNLRFFLFLFPSAFLLSLQLFSFPGKKHSKKHLSTLQIVPISSAPLRKNVFWPRPKFIAFFDCLSSSLRIPELAFTSVIRTALACLVAIFSVLTPKSSIFDLRHRVNYFFFIRLGFAEHFPRTPYHFFVVLLRARLLLLKNILLIVFSFFFFLSRCLSTNHLHLGFLETSPSGSRLSKPSKSLYSLVLLLSAIFIASHSLALHIFTSDWYVLLLSVPSVGSY